MNLANKKILVAGGNGFLGPYVIQKLIDHGAQKENMYAPRGEACDLRVLENCEKAVAGRELALNLAGTTGNAQFHRDHPAEIFYDNLMIGIQLMEAARRAGVQKFISIGSATEYPENALLPYTEENLWLGFPAPTHAPYSIAKKMTLVQAQAYRAEYGFNGLHVILTNMYGSGEPFGREYVIPTLIRKMLAAAAENAPYVELWGTVNATRDFIYVDDAAEGIVLAAEKYDKSDPVNIASGWEISIKELADIIAEFTGFAGEVRWDASKPDGQMRRVLDTTRAEKEFGFRARTDFKTGLQATVEWYRKLLSKQ